MRLPLTTAISNALLFKVGGHVYALPNVHVLGTVEAIERAGEDLPGQLDFEGAAVPLVLLHGALAAPAPRAGAAVPAVVMDYASHRLALAVDKIVGPREIVVKNLGPLLSPLPLYVGGTISGSGKVQLILDPAALVRLAYPEAAAAGAARRRSPAARVLVADDSPAVREAMAHILERAGYQVDAAATGLSAWRMLGRARYDALVTDLQMPEMGGVELIERLRADPVLAHLPVVVVSSRATPADAQLDSPARTSRKSTRRRGTDTSISSTFTGSPSASVKPDRRPTIFMCLSSSSYESPPSASSLIIPSTNGSSSSTKTPKACTPETRAVNSSPMWSRMR
jgi:CheY-like chemotaxis protein